MYRVARTALVEHSSEQMYSLVNDVASYADFLPWCGGSEVLEASDEHMLAAVTIDFKGVYKTFTTNNHLCLNQGITMQLVDGPFSQLGGDWQFKALTASACKISLTLEFDFDNRLIGAIIGPVFKGIADSMVDSFVKEADHRYARS